MAHQIKSFQGTRTESGWKSAEDLANEWLRDFCENPKSNIQHVERITVVVLHDEFGCGYPCIFVHYVE